MPGPVADLEELESVDDLFSFKGKLQILFVGEDEERNVLQGFFGQKLLELLLAFSESVLVGRVDDVDEGIVIFNVVLPVSPDSSLTADIPDIELETILRESLDVEALGGHNGAHIFFR